MTSALSPGAHAVSGGPGGPCYIYGITASAADVSPGLRGVGDPPGRVCLVPHRGIAAITSHVPAERPLGTAADLRAHARVLDDVARSAAVLPMRFGGVMTDDAAVVTELLTPH